MADIQSPDNLRALVDMGSNGIRFSISDLAPSRARIMPTLYQDRAAISLYDAQYSTGTKAAIPENTIVQVLHSFANFKQTCEDFCVLQENIRVVATEATREAINGVEFRDQIKATTGWTVEVLPKAEEGRIGALGIASSLASVKGLVLDLGGGSVQMSWIETERGDVQVYGSTSLPYGAAALLRRLEQSDKNEKLSRQFEEEVTDSLQKTFESISKELHDTHNGTGEPMPARFPVFLSGGGFRGCPYPIPIINGFLVDASVFREAPTLAAQVAANASKDDGPKVFRISERRETQIPAIAFLVAALVKTIGKRLTSVCFAQGGVREGLLFGSLPPAVRSTSPLGVATRQYAAPAAADLRDLIAAAVPKDAGLAPPGFENLLGPFADLLFVHASASKEVRAVAALRSTTTGVLADVHGLAHAERAALALLLCARWGGQVPPSDKDYLARLQALAGPRASWWCGYAGRVGGLVGAVYPAGRVGQARVQLAARAAAKGLALTVAWQPASGVRAAAFAKQVKTVAQAGKKKHGFVATSEGLWGLKVAVDETGDTASDAAESGDDD